MANELPEFTFRGLEMHGPRMWRPERLSEALSFAAEHQMTALVLHDNTIMHDTTFPRQYFNDSQRKGYAQVRRHQNAIYAKQAYLRNLLKQAKALQIEIWVEVKELEFPDEVLERFPHLIKDGVICPTDPVWFEYLQLKTGEFFELFPEVAGIILSPGSPESRAYLSSGRKCSCERCRGTDFGDWCHDIIMSVHRAARPLGKKLALRDFVYSPEDHERLGKIIEQTPEDVIFCIKTTPRDFWPTFPHNPMIGRYPERTQWIEYDVFGQFYGWGVCPAIVLEDLKERFRYAKSRGVSGALLRTEWENVIELSCFDNLNLINLIGGAHFALDLKIPESRIVAMWLSEESLAADLTAAAIDIEGLTRFLLKTWPIMKKTIYIDGFVFATCSEFPLNVDKAWFTMTFYHSLSAWAPETAGRIRLDYANLLRLLDEKDQAYQEIKALIAELKPGGFGLPEAAYLRLKESFQHYERYVKGFRLCAGACLLSKALLEESYDAAAESDLTRRLERTLDELALYVRDLKAFEAITIFPYYVYLIHDYRNAQGILDQARQFLEEHRRKKNGK